MELTPALLNQVVDVAYEAGEEILSIYTRQDVEIEHKKDGSPLTQADLLAHETIVSGLKKINANIPILSEESHADDIRERHQWPVLWLVDPLDGTKEFIHRTDEFTVNIALIIKHQPVLGVVYAPALGVMYFAMQGFGAYKEVKQKRERMLVSDRLKTTLTPQDNLRVIASRRHHGEALDKFLSQFPRYSLVQAGSALKICLVAEGVADLYPRLAPTYEWDTAAGHALMREMQGDIYDEKYRSFLYNVRETLLNGFFVASASHLQWSW